MPPFIVTIQVKQSVGVFGRGFRSFMPYRICTVVRSQRQPILGVIAGFIGDSEDVSQSIVAFQFKMFKRQDLFATGFKSIAAIFSLFRKLRVWVALAKFEQRSAFRVALR